MAKYINTTPERINELIAKEDATVRLKWKRMIEEVKRTNYMTSETAKELFRAHNYLFDAFESGLYCASCREKVFKRLLTIEDSL